MSDANKWKPESEWEFDEAWLRDLSSALEKVKSGGGEPVAQPASLSGTIGGSYPKANEGAGKRPSERAAELYAKRHRMPPINAQEMVDEHATLWEVLDERLGRAP